MFVTTKASVLTVLCACALLATACGGGSSSGSSDVASGNTSSDSQSENVDNGAGQSRESPLGDLLGLPFGNDEEADQYFEDLSRQAEVKIAECMIAQGFEYHIVDYGELGGFSAGADFESREYAEQYGFGIASNPYEESFEAIESFDNPNQEYVISLSDGEREAYETALRGELPDFNSDAVQTFEPTGCQGDAYEEAFAFVDVFDQFGDAFDELEQAYEADPRIVTANSGWSNCMTEAGYRFTDQNSAREDIERRYTALVQDPDAFEDGLAPPPSDAGDSGEVFVVGPQSLSPEIQAQADELADEERKVALASWDCNAPVREIEDDVQLEMEQRFVDEHGAAIQAALDE